MNGIAGIRALQKVALFLLRFFQRLRENKFFAFVLIYSFVTVPGRLRTNTKVLDIDSQVLTELNEKGGRVEQSDIETLKSVIRKEAPGCSIVILAGSVPQGVQDTIYAELIAELKSIDAKVILDAEKSLLVKGIDEAPYLIKPNLYEYNMFVGENCRTLSDVVRNVTKILDKNVEIACISFGAYGAMICSKKEAYYAKGLKLDVRGIQGAGDSMVAGISKAMNQGKGIEVMLRYGMAASAGSLVLDGTQMCDKGGFDAYLDKIETVDITEMIKGEELPIGGTIIC
ncbi:MAG: hypothetical protein IJX90_07460 [Blautia sp.]|nr:hypothetical protein [Blautia sp.]